MIVDMKAAETTAHAGTFSAVGDSCFRLLRPGEAGAGWPIRFEMTARRRCGRLAGSAVTKLGASSSRPEEIFGARFRFDIAVGKGYANPNDLGGALCLDAGFRSG